MMVSTCGSVCLAHGVHRTELSTQLPWLYPDQVHSCIHNSYLHGWDMYFLILPAEVSLIHLMFSNAPPVQLITIVWGWGYEWGRTSHGMDSHIATTRSLISKVMQNKPHAFFHSTMEECPHQLSKTSLEDLSASASFPVHGTVQSTLYSVELDQFYHCMFSNWIVNLSYCYPLFNWSITSHDYDHWWCLVSASHGVCMEKNLSCMVFKLLHLTCS